MAKSIHVTDDVRLLIADIHGRNPDWGPTKVHEELLHELDRSGIRQKLGAPKGWPDVSTVGKELRKIKPPASNTALMGQDEPWSTATLDRYPAFQIPPDALPVVLKVWKARTEKDSGFSVREAKWVARLSFMISDIEVLAETARRYASLERLYAMTGIPFNSRALDKRLMDIRLDYDDPFEPGAGDLPPWIDKDGEIIDFSSPDAEKKFYEKRKGGSR